MNKSCKDYSFGRSNTRNIPKTKHIELIKLLIQFDDAWVIDNTCSDTSWRPFNLILNCDWPWGQTLDMSESHTHSALVQLKCCLLVSL